MELARGLLQALAAEYGGPLTLRGAFPDTANRHRRLAVLRGCQRLKVASVLIECGFLTNAEDLAMMQSVEYGLALGRAIGRVADRNRIVVHSLTNK
jgi:N-acetylmuramoyl-L-alanine amidase